MGVTPTFIERLLHRLHLLPTPVLDSFANVLFGRVLAVAVRCGVFETLKDTPLSPAEVARATGLNDNALELLLDSLEVGGYLRRRKGGYILSIEGRKWLVSDSPAYMGNLLLYFETLCERWGYLEFTLRHGKPPRAYYETFTDDDWKTYVLGMRDLARIILPHVRKRLVVGSGARRLLDVGGSHGLYAIDACMGGKDLHATIVDFEQALRHTRLFVQEAGLEQRINLSAGDILRMDLDSNYDAVFLFNVVHGFTPEENRRLVARLMDALKPGGRLYILDQVRDERRRSGVAAFLPLMVGMNLFNETGGRTYTMGEISAWCIGAKRTTCSRLRLPGVVLLTATR
jgi:SAM-dependent methyltransferase